MPRTFTILLELFAIWIAAFIPIAAFYPYLSGLLTIDWRDWMTEHLSHRMFDRDALYHIMRSHAVDNPDQRISEDINSFTDGALNYSMTVLQADRYRSDFLWHPLGRYRIGSPCASLAYADNRDLANCDQSAGGSVT